MDMKNVFAYYISRNGIRFHHTLTKAENFSSDTAPPEMHDECELTFLISGTTIYHVDGQQFPLSAGDVCIIPPQLMHWRSISGDDDYERMVLHIDPTLFPPLQDLDVLAFSKRANEYLYVLSADLIAKTDLVKQLETIKNICCDENKYRDLRMVAAVTAMAETLNELASEMINQRTLTLRSTKNNISHLCIEYINGHLEEKLTAEVLSKQVNMSASHLQAMFKKEVGVSLHKYILTQKMYLARKMLHQGMPALEVAQKLGFEYYATFHQAYRRINRTAPRTYSKIGHTLRTNEELK